MLFPIRTPRVNNNDDTVRLSAVFPAPGTLIQEGEMVAEVETDKATFTVEADRAGYFLQCPHAVGDTVSVGSVLVWMGEDAGDAAPEKDAGNTAAGNSAEPTLKAALLLKQYGLEAGRIPSASGRLSAAEVEAWIAAHALSPRDGQVARTNMPPLDPAPNIPSRREDFNVMERGMMRTVAWHRDEAVPGYVEILYDASAWEAYGAAFQKEHRLLLNPLLSLMAHRLIALPRINANYNASIHADRKLLFEPVNIGFTVQSGDHLYLTVVRDAGSMTPRQFVTRLGELQKAAMKNRLDESETSGATVGFTSMARWSVARHQPVLPPYTSLMVAHSAAYNGVSALGATYDHRLLTGADAVKALHLLKEPPAGEE